MEFQDEVLETSQAAGLRAVTNQKRSVLTFNSAKEKRPQKRPFKRRYQCDETVEERELPFVARVDQYSSGRSSVVTLRSASVMIQSFNSGSI